jgi:voltage-gated potassium channel
MELQFRSTSPGWQNTAYRIIFASNTRSGRVFDIILLLAIVLSVLTVMLDSVQSIRAELGCIYRQSNGGLPACFCWSIWRGDW